MNQIDKFTAMQLSFDRMMDDWFEEDFEEKAPDNDHRDFDTFEW